MRPIRIINGQIITPSRVLHGATLSIAGGKISAIGEGDIAGPDTLPDALPDTLTIDAAGKYVAPGFIDIHVHGGGGHDFMDGTEEAFLAIARLHARHGTTSMTPTTMSCDGAELRRILEVYEQVSSQNGPGAGSHDAEFSGAGFIGMHLEGPYFSMNQRGAQDPRYIRDPDPDEYRELISRFPSVRRWSAAPELNGALDLAKYLRSKGVLAALAHTDAVYEEVLKGFEKGFTHATHLYSAMLGVTRRGAVRYAGAVESAYLIDEMTVEIIADGIHLPPPLLKLVYKIKGADRTALITDAMRGAGMPAGESILGSRQNGLRVIIEDGVAKLPDRSAFAGSVATADRLVRNMVQLADVPLCDAVRMMTSTPAAIMGVADRKGELAPGKDADIVIFDEQIDVAHTIVGGRVVYGRVVN
jgi:N-acetylglucosamine-6-phosphate deacetylase